MSTTITATPTTNSPLSASSVVTASQITASPSPTDTSSSNSNPSGLASSSSLYLYTFLATLVLLLAVSAAIVVRSYVLRRRHQALVEEAIRNGTWVPPPFGQTRHRGGRREVGEKPTMWEAWVGKDREVMRRSMSSDGGVGGSGEKGAWEDILPMTATYVDQTNANSKPSSTLNNNYNRGHTHPVSTSFFPWRRNANTGPSPAASTTNIQTPNPASSSNPALAPSSSTNAATPAPTPAPQPTLQVTVLIAMPAPPNSRSHSSGGRSGDDDDEGPPVVEFGVMNVGVGQAHVGSSSTGDGAGVTQ